MTEDPNHLQMVYWGVGTVVATGGIMLEIIRRMIKGKRSVTECDLLHKSVTDGITDIKDRLEKGATKMDGMKETLVEISTTLKLRSSDETERYMRHTEDWKNK